MTEINDALKLVLGAVIFLQLLQMWHRALCFPYPGDGITAGFHSSRAQGTAGLQRRVALTGLSGTQEEMAFSAGSRQ